MNEVALTVPNFTAAGLAGFTVLNPVPVTMTAPPLSGPEAGVTAVVVGTFGATEADADGLAASGVRCAAFTGGPVRATVAAAVLATVMAAAAPRACFGVGMRRRCGPPDAGPGGARVWSGCLRPALSSAA
ncbi:hypothetical protein GCM10023107_89730 [Actinoplanes octamycinicus]|nr:hypothetical protein Aoc01nite_65130 [Actinoplanes octamycinicus]